MSKWVQGVSNDTAGAISEMVAAADLMRKGYEVFRAVNPGSPCDLIAMKDGWFLRIQVRTTAYHDKANGQRSIYKPRFPKDKGNTDRYAFVANNTVIYEDVS
jgi:predicted AAA+ superfamily ATPase